MGNNVFVINEPVAYADAMKWFEEPYQEDKIFILEHQDVYTCGKSVSDEEFARIAPNGKIMGTPAIRASRGGLWTWHGKGQIVVYFICNLRKNHMTLDDWFRQVEGAVLASLNDIIKRYNVRGINVYADKDNAMHAVMSIKLVSSACACQKAFSRTVSASTLITICGGLIILLHAVWKV